MRSFKDLEGTTWKLSIDFGVLAEIREMTGVRLGLIEHPIILPDDMPPDMWKDQPGVVRLFQDVELTYAIIYVLCKEQADELNLSNIQFARRIAEKGVQSKAFFAFWEELRDFFQSLRKDHLSKMIEKYQVVLQAAMKMIDRQVEQQVSLIEESVNSMNSSSDKQDTLESIRGDLPSDSLTG